MNAYFSFTDECGNYHRDRKKRNVKADPFYVRATLIISLEDYLELQGKMNELKIAYGLGPKDEIKWSHYGSARKGRFEKVPGRFSAEWIVSYIKDLILLLTSLKTAEIYYTFTDNAQVNQIDSIKFYGMHLQNAMQRIQHTMETRNGFSILVADELSDSKSTKELKKDVYAKAMNGDFVQYKNIKKGFYIDYSNQCQGLQMADICAGVFTATLKCMKADVAEKHKYQDAYQLFMDHLYTKVRCYSERFPYYEVHGIGVSEVPRHTGEELAKRISREINEHLERDLLEWCQ